MNKNIDIFFNSLKDNVHISPGSIGVFTKKYTEEIVNYALNSSDEEKIQIAEKFVSLAENAKGETSFYLFSAALSLSKNKNIHKKLLDAAYRDREILGAENIFAIYQQSANFTFSHPTTDSLEVLKLKNELYNWSLQKYTDQLKDLLSPIPYKSRDNMVIMIAQQVIAYQHGPTKSALCRCKALMDHGYKVLLINTAELLSKSCSISFIGETYASYNEEYLDKDYLEWEGVKIPFFQCEQNMPNCDTIRQLITVIRDLKPSFTISIASGTIVEGLLSKIIPVFAVPMTQSELAVSGANYQAYSGPKNQKFFDCLNALNLAENRIIDTIFGFSILPQKIKRQRSDYGISDDTFLLITAGGRLQDELDDAFWDTFRNILHEIPDIKIMTIGNYSKEDKNNDINTHIICTGFVDDILSWIDLCNLYINPHRKGGGTSCVEAMYCGLPVVTDMYGDVASNAGNEFCVKDYSSFAAIIKKYYDDKTFYKKQSHLAKTRADILLNADEEFIRAVNEMKKRSLCY